MKINKGYVITALRKIRKTIPRPSALRGTWLHGKLGEGLLCKSLWTPEKVSVSWGVSIGIFWAMMPLPFQMIPSVITAFLMKVNVPAAMISVWITNPITWPVILFSQYKIGEFFLLLFGWESQSSPSLALLPLAIGCIATAIPASTFAFIATLAISRQIAKFRARPRLQVPRDLEN